MGEPSATSTLPFTADELNAAACWPKVVMLGDSLTQKSMEQGGFGQQLATALARRCDVLVRGFSGYNTRWLLPAVKHILADPAISGCADSIAAFCILLGTNDASLPRKSVPLDQLEQHVPVQEFADNLGAIIQAVVEVGIDETKVVLLSPPPVAQYKWLNEMEKCGFDTSELLRSNEYTESYAACVAEFAAKHKLAHVDLYNEFLGIENWQDLLIDGLHLSDSGNKLVFDLLWPSIAASIDYANSDVILPSWKQVRTGII